MSLFRKGDDEATAYRSDLTRFILLAIAVIAVVTYASLVSFAYNTTSVMRPHAIGAPVRAPAGVFLLTGQRERRVTGGGSVWTAFRGLENVTHVDAWRLDADAAAPVWRKRIATEPSRNIGEIAVLGADDDRLWLFVHEPLVVSIETGEVVGNAKGIEARAAPRTGPMPKQLARYRFVDGAGLVVTAADSRAWLLDVQTFAAVPWQGSGPIGRETAVGAQPLASADAKRFQKRGFALPHQWLGLLTDDEANALKSQAASQQRGASVAFTEYLHAPPDLSHAGSNRYRLWQAKIEEVSAAPPGWPKSAAYNWGTRPRYTSFTVLEKSPQLVQAGLLTDGRSAAPLLLTAPESVLVLHRDRADDEGKLRVARLAGPDGRLLWDAALPLSVLESVMPGQDRLVLYGRAHVSQRPRGADPNDIAHDWIVSINLIDGATRAVDLAITK